MRIKQLLTTQGKEFNEITLVFQVKRHILDSSCTELSGGMKLFALIHVTGTVMLEFLTFCSVYFPKPWYKYSYFQESNNCKSLKVRMFSERLNSLISNKYYKKANKILKQISKLLITIVNDATRLYKSSAVAKASLLCFEEIFRFD